MPLKPGHKLLNGQYRIEAQLGLGGFGAVYRAYDMHLREDVAIKELSPALLGDDEMLKRFLAEAKATMRLSHDRLVRTHHVFTEADPSASTPAPYYIVMEFMPGSSLEEMLEARGSLPVDEAVRITAEIAEGLAYAHGRGVVHCDLKPANILFDAEGSTKIADFGIAHVSERMLTRTWHTAEGFVAGTLTTMSPEQTRGQRDDARIDVYALGALLYHLLAGRPYLDFGEEDTPYALADTILRIHNEQPLPPSAHNPAIPAWLDAIVLKALRKLPDDRFASAGEMRAALMARRAGLRTEAPKPAGMDPAEAGATGAPESAPQQPAEAVPPAVARAREPAPVTVPSSSLPRLADLRAEIAAAIEQARRSAELERREAAAPEPGLADRDSGDFDRRLHAAEETLKRAADRIGDQFIGRQLAPLFDQLGAMLEGKADELARLATLPTEPPKQSRVRPSDLGIDLVRIPAGLFLYGEPKKRIDLPEFLLSRTPVTNAQFAAFLEASGHPAPPGWKPVHGNPDLAGHPAVNVSWLDATAFCAWLGGRLPSEQEWEKGARGTDGLAYPWGDEWLGGRCNVTESGIGGTSAVDRFPPGASPYGLLDMLGNTWEWCADSWAGKREGAHKVIRGGSFDWPASKVRCTTRRRMHPAASDRNIGFRVALSPD